MLKKLLLSGVCLTLMTGCSWLGDWPPPGNGSKNAKVQQPQVKMVQTADATWLEPVQGNVREQLVPSDGVNVATEERVEELEKQLADMRSDIGLMMPALTRLAEAQNNLVNTLSQMQPASGLTAAPDYPPQQQAYVEESPYAAPPAPPPLQPQPQTMTPQAPVALQPPAQQQQLPAQPQQAAYGQQQQPAPQAMPYPYHGQQQMQPPPQQQQPPAQQVTPQQAAYNQAAMTARAEIRDVRFGEHPDKTRIVMDVSDIVPFSYEIDNQQKILVIDFPGASWNGQQDNRVADSPLVESYSVVPNGQGGMRVIMNLYSQAKVVWAQSIPSVGGKDPRAVIDITML